MRGRRLNERGNIILPLLMIAAAAAVIGYAALDILRVGRVGAVSEERRVEAEALATDILEITKFLMIYEPIFYTDSAGPLNHEGARGDQLRALLASGIGAGSGDGADLFKACGGYDAKGRQVGQFNVKGLGVFCPMYLRSALLSTDMLDQMVLRPLAQKNVLKNPKEGQYVLELVYFDRDQGIDSLSGDAHTFVGFNMGQGLLRAADFRVSRVSARIRILTGGAGFTSKSSERFFEISTEIRLGGTASDVIVGRRQSYVSYPSTPRDFALFMPYPAKFDGTNTRKWSESVVLPAGSTIDGRVFFNGDIDVPLARLPNFTEIVVIAGDFVPPLTKDERKALKEKFPKGLITNYSAARYLMSGKCSRTDPSVEIANGTNFLCRTLGHDTTIEDYLANSASKCVRPEVTSDDSTIKVLCDETKDAASCPTDCPAPALIAGPRRLITTGGTYAFIAAPVARLMNGASSLYGTILGGHFESTVPVHLYSMALLKTGLPGVGSEEILNNYSGLFQQAYAGISVPLENLPIVYEEGLSR